MKNSKKHIGASEILCYACAVILAIFLVSAVPSEEEAEIYDSVIRLHVLANSDSEADQTLKLRVRDAILERYGAQLAKYESVEDASGQLDRLCGEIESFTRDALSEMGSDYDVSVTFTREQYPTRVYENDVTLPAGSYRSLRVIIGEGEGANWWCVLFPPLCLSASYGAGDAGGDSIPVGLTYDQYKFISGADEPEYVLKFKFLELFGS